jgi:hypothetical protein
LWKKNAVAANVAFFRAVKEKIAKTTEGMTLQQRRDYFQKVREGKIKLT